MSVRLEEYKVRFGDMSYGPLMHASAYYDLVIRGCEHLSHEIDYRVEDVVAAGGVPFAPAAIDIDIDQYPPFDATIVTSARVLYVGDRSFGVEYTFKQANSRHLATASVSHVTLTPEGNPETIPDNVRANLEALREGPATRIERPKIGEPPEDDELTFRSEATFRTPMVEAVDFGYFEEYFRLMVVGLEEYLAARDISIRDGGEARYPFVPLGGNFEFVEPIRFEDTVSVRGTLLDVDPRTVTLEYEFTGGDEEDRRIAGTLPFGCFDADGERIPFPSALLERLPDVP